MDEKILLKSQDDLLNFMNTYWQKYLYGGLIRELITGVGRPDSYPAILVVSIESCADNGMFLVSEYVYPSDFEGE